MLKHPDHPPVVRSIWGIGLFFLLVLLAACSPAALPEKQPLISTLRVVMDNNYPPYVFQDEQGHLQGILVDQWKLWEERTGVKVEITAIPWGEALERMKAGEFDVIDTIFYTVDRGQIFDFTDPYAQINVRIFFQKNISGIVNAADLKGFRVAVKTGDANADYLLRRGVTDLTYYNSYGEIVQAAKRKEETIFVIDQPPGLYFLYKYGLQEQFNYSESLYGGEFHRAVKKGNHQLLDLVVSGFSRITKAEYQAIDTRWFGSSQSNSLQQLMPYLTVGAIIVFLIILALLIFNRMLRNRVQTRTLELREALSGLQKSETRFREAIEFFPVPVGIADAQGNILSVNRKFFEEYGYSLEDIPSVAEWMLRAYPDPEYRATAQFQWDADVVDAVKNGTSTTLREYKVTCKDGSRRDVEIVMHPIGDLWVASFNNITERKQVGDALRENRRFLADLIEYGGALIFVKDREGRYDLINRKWEEVTGLKRENVIGNTDEVLFPGPTGRQFRTNDLEVIESGHVIEREEILDGEVRRYFISIKFPIHDENGKVKGICGMTIEITERKRAEAALRESEENYRNLVELSPDAIIVHSEGKIVFANSATVRLIRAKNVGEILGLPVIGFVHPDQRVIIAARIKEMQDDGVKGAPLEEKFICLDGTVLDVEVAAMPIIYEGKSAIQVIARDISERKKIVDSLKASEEKYRTLIETVNVGIFMSTLDGKFLQANSAVVEMAGYANLEEFMQIPAQSLFADVADQEWTMAELHSQGYVKNVEVRSVKKSGTIYWISLSAVLLKDVEGKPISILGSAIDITDRKHSAEALQESEKRFRTLIENSADALTLLNADGSVFYEGPTVKRLTGYSAAERLGMSAFDNVFPEDLPMLRSTLAHVLTSPNASVTAQFRSIRKDGSIWWTEAIATNLLHDSGVQAIVVNYRDITVRKQAEENLRESEQRYRALFEQANDAIFIEDDNDRIIDANERACGMLGYTKQELLSMTVSDFIAPEMERRSLAVRKELADYGGKPFESVDVRKDGVRISVEVTNAIISEHVTLSIVRDITDRKKDQAALQKSEERNRAIVAALPDLLFEISSDGRFLDCIASDPSRFLVPPEQAIGRRVDELLPAELAALTMKKIQQTLSEGVMQVFDYSLQLHQTMEYYESRMTPLGPDSVLSLVRDITKRKHTEEELRNSENRFRILFEHAGVGVAQLDSHTGRFLQVNQKYCEIVGYTRDELEQLDFHVITHPEDLQKDLDNMERLIAGEIAEFTMEKRYYRKNGTLVWVILIVSPLWLPGEKPDTHIAVVHDITEQKRTEFALRYSEAEVRNLNAELERRVTERTAQLENTNRELEAFSYSVSHDLRAPLRAIDGFSRIVLEDHASQLDGEVQKLLGHVRVESQRMAQLIEALLNLSRMGRIEMRRETVNLSSLAQMILDGLRQAQPQRQVECIIASEVTAQGDTRLLSIVLENLLGNAWKFTSKRGQAKIEFGMERRENEAVYFVRDNGAGFDMAYTEKLFGAFQRLHGQHEFEGTGIGLATVQRIISRHGGRVWPEAEVDQGATFYFTLG